MKESGLRGLNKEMGLLLSKMGMSIPANGRKTESTVKEN